MKIDNPTEPWVQSVLASQHGLDVVTRPDLTVRIGNSARPFVVEARRRVDAAAAHAVLALARGTPEDRRLLLVAERTTVGAREILDAHGIAFIDGEGNVSVRVPGLFVRTGSFGAGAVIVRPAKVQATARLAGKAGLIAQALLLERDRPWQLLELAALSGVSNGLAHRVLVRLEQVGIVAVSGRGPGKVRSLANAAALLDLWAEEDFEPRVRRATGYVLVQPGVRLAGLISERLERAGIAHAVTGVAAAGLLAPALTSVAVAQVRVSAAVLPPPALRALDARPVDEGANVVLLQGVDDAELRFRREVDGVWLAADTRIYLDALRDPRRGREQADAFRATVLRIRR